MTRAGIVGAGFSATSHIDALRRVGVEVAAVVASTEDKAYAIADRYGIPKAASHYEEVLADDDIGAIHNCTPNYLHAEINEAALRAGKHLLSEKPLGMSSAETARLAALADEVDTVTAVCFNYRHYPLVRQAREMLDAGSLGPPHFIHGDYLQDWLLYGSDWNWRLEKDKAGGSRALADIGSHWLDLVQYLLQDHVTEVLGRLGTLHTRRLRPATTTATFGRPDETGGEPTAIDTEDLAAVLLRFAGGALGAVNVSQVSPGHRNRLRLEIDAADASLAWDQEDANRLWIGRRDRPNEELVRDPGLLCEAAADLAHFPGGHQEGWPDALRNLCEDFYAATDDGSHEGSFATFSEAHRVVVTIEAILESHAAGSWVEVDAQGVSR